ncbi:DUF3291 domain-containing protein [Croceiramulus getboli]|nr:DUF3291 domain-containing protein [Flavobacteriaceae bacterium YJPT1-3]
MHLAQVNIARMKGPIDSPIMADFVANLDRINALAEKHKGFVWRMQGDDGNATALRVFEDDELLINLSVWKDHESLFEYVYHSAHVEIMKRRKEWFQHMKSVHMALWYVDQEHQPDPQEAKERLAHIRANGESPFAFTFKNKYTPKEALTYHP